MKTFIKSGFWTTKKTGATPKGWLELTKLIEDNISSNYKPSILGSLKITDAAPTIQGMYILSDVGTYTNLGGINAPIGKLNFASFDGTTWKIISVDVPKGDTGLQGIQGIQGDKGDKGDTGATGLQGIQGIQGVKGDKGDKGDAGLASELKGTLKTTDTAPTAQGLYILSDVGTYANLGGLVTTTGKINYAYFDGTTWSMVEVAIQSGKSAYEVAVANGFVGTEQEWLDSLKSNPTGIVEAGNTDAVSGGQVFETINPLLKLKPPSLPFTLSSGRISSTNGFIDTSVNWLNLKFLSASANTNYRVYDLPAITTINQAYRIAFYNSTTQNTTTFISGIANNASGNIDFTTPANTQSFAIQIISGNNVGASPSTSPYKDSVKLFNLTSNNPIIDEYLVAEKIKGEILTPQITEIQNITDIVASSISYSYANIPITLTTGLVKINGEVAGTSGYLRTSTSAANSMANVDDSKTYVYTGEINIADYSGLTGVIYKDKNFKLLGYELNETGVYNRKKLTLPAGTKYIAACSKGSNPIIEEEFASLDGNKLVYVDASYSGESEGSEIKPYKTINEAIEAVNGGGKIVIRTGDYRETLALGTLSSGDYSFEVNRASKVRILGSEKLSGWVLTSGQTNTYEIPFTGTIPTATRFGKIIYEDGNPSRPILDDEKHPLQKGLSYRLPFTEIVPKTSIAEVEAQAGTFYHDTVNGKLYLHASNSTNPKTNGFSYENAVRGFNTTPSAQTNKIINLSLSGLQFMYSTGGLSSVGFNTVRRENITVIGTIDYGCFRDDTSNIIAYNDEGAFCNGDGINGHFSSWGNYQSLTDHRSMQPVNVYYDCWMHDNWDDGISHHENHRYIIYGMLSEYNGDGGVRGSNDSNGTIYNGYSRKNGQTDPSGGEGFSVVNPTINVNRNGCKLLLFNCFAEGNQRGYSSISDDRNVIELINCISRNNLIAELNAGSGKVISRNTLATNATPSKLKVTGGTGVITIKNDTLLT